MTDNDRATKIVVDAFKALRNKDGRGATWMDRDAALSHERAGRYMAHIAAEAILNVAMQAASGLKPGQTHTGHDADYTFEIPHGGSERVTVAVSERAGTDEWSVSAATGIHGKEFAIRRRFADDTNAIIASGSWSKTMVTGKGHHSPYRIVNCNLGSDGFHSLLKLVVTVRADITAARPLAVHASEPAGPVVEADGWVPGANCRKLYRALYEDSARRVLDWAGPLFDETARMFASEGILWGTSALAWSYGTDARFPRFDALTTYSCLVPREGRPTTAAVFRDARPYLETVTYLVWREPAPTGAPGSINILPVDDLATDDIEAFMASGGVPAISYDPASGNVRVTEKAMSSNVLETFARHIGEAWSVLRDRPLYANGGDPGMFLRDFTVFDRLEPWTRRGRALARQTADEEPTTKKSPRP